MNNQKIERTFYLVRHCDYANPRGILPGRLPVELSEQGKEEALRLQKYFVDKDIEVIYSSAVLRCKQTSETISNGKIPIIYDQRLLELFSAYQGYWEKDWKYFFAHRAELGGESEADVQKRIMDFSHDRGLLQYKNIIVCSHGDPLYFLYQSLTKQPFLPETIPGEEPVIPNDYPPKGSVRIVHIVTNGEVKIEPLIYMGDRHNIG